MISTIASALSGVNLAVSRATQAAGNIVKASSTGENLDANLIDLSLSSTDLAASAFALKEAQKQQKTLLDIIA